MYQSWILIQKWLAALDVSLVADAMMQNGEETVDFLSGINNPPAW